MKQTIIRYGLISGVISSALMTATSLIGKYIIEKHGGLKQFFDNGAYLGFTCIILSLTLVFIAIKTYRDQQNDGRITFGKAFLIGISVTAISCTCYALTWLIFYYNVFPTFMEDYAVYQLQKMKEEGATAATLAKQAIEMRSFNEKYQNPLFNFGLTFMEPFPVGLLMTAVSALLLKKK
ncbi:MAG: DUF4199 domain-containing protein [Spirosomataceae bacterium]